MELFITGTGTGIGKTFVTALLARILADQGVSAGVQKWVSTGDSSQADDLAFIAGYVPSLANHATGIKALESVYCLAFPSSPHLAAEKEGVHISTERIKTAFHEMKRHFQVLMAEGAGGLMVPLSRDTLIIDLVAELKIPAVVVAASGLGTINHTLLSIEALKNRDIPCAGIVLNSQGYAEGTVDKEGIELEHPDIVRDNARVIEEFSGVPVLGTIRRVALFHDALGDGETIYQNLRRQELLP